MRVSDRAWLALACSVVAYDLLIRDDEQLSSATDRYLESHPWLTRGVVALTGAHLLNLLPTWCDPFQAGVAARKLRDKT